jgi:hypothetical protein
MLRFALSALLGVFVAGCADAQGYYGQPPMGYGYAAPTPDAWSAAREEWHRARRAEDIARWRAANGDYEGANRAQFWAEQHRERARRDAYVARGGW